LKKYDKLELRPPTKAPISILTKSLLAWGISAKNRRATRQIKVIDCAMLIMNLAQKNNNFLFSRASPPPPNKDLE